MFFNLSLLRRGAAGGEVKSDMTTSVLNLDRVLVDCLERFADKKMRFISPELSLLCIGQQLWK